jgi:hypothetical protein
LTSDGQVNLQYKPLTNGNKLATSGDSAKR